MEFGRRKRLVPSLAKPTRIRKGVVNISIPYSLIEDVSQSLGLPLLGVLTRRNAESALRTEAKHLSQWQAKGFAAEMQYMQRDPSLFSSLEGIFPEAKSILLFVAPYSSGTEKVDIQRGHGRIARYAWGRDYHEVLRSRLEAIRFELEKKSGVAISARSFSDAVPILERALGRRAALGFIGRNSMLIRPGWGSYTFIAEMLLSVEVCDAPHSEILNAEPPGSGCGSCTRCIPACPTSAITDNAVIDSARCIAYISIEKKGALDGFEKKALGNWLFGCDICQEVCPFNVHPKFATPLEEFSQNEGPGSQLAILDVLRLHTNQLFREKFLHTALSRAGRARLIRNACALVENQSFTEATHALVTLTECDPSELVRNAALEALRTIHPFCEGVEKRAAQRALSRVEGSSPSGS